MGRLNFPIPDTESPYYTEMPSIVALLAATFAAGSTLVHGAERSLHVELPRVTQPPVLDGRLDDPVWQHAARLTQFTQYDPGDQVPPSERSVALVAYDHENFYFAFRAWEPSRGDVRATLFPREHGGDNDDRVTFYLDTFDDKRRAYEFRVTPLGIQSDAVKIEGHGPDFSVDFVWHSAGRVYDDGWAVEVAIPFASLRFPPRDTIAIGFNVIRVYGRSGEKDAWAPRLRGSPCDICQEGVLTGITGIDDHRTVDVMPYLAASRSGERQYGTDSVYAGGAWRATSPPEAYAVGRPQATVGTDVRVALTPALVLNGTINPDFSQVESDADQIRVNQRFALFLDERRPFFLEGRDVFRIGGGGLGDLFYSRAIVDPNGGIRLTGKHGRYTGGVLLAHDQAPALFYYDGYDGSGVESDIASAADAVVGRIRRDVLDDSYIGAAFLGRRVGAAHDGVAAADFSLRSGSFTLSGEGAHSMALTPLDTASATATTDSTGRATLACPDGYDAASGGRAWCVDQIRDGARHIGDYYRVRLSRSGERVGISFQATGASPGFRDQLGRFGRIGVESYGGGVGISQYPDGDVVQRVSEGFNVTRTNIWQGGLLDWVASPNVSVQLQRRTHVNLGVDREHLTLFDVPLDMNGLSAGLSTNAWQSVGFGASLFIGQREVFDPEEPHDPRVGDGYIGGGWVTVQPTSQATLELHAQRSVHYEDWGGALTDDAKIVRLRGTFQFTRELGVRLIGEYSNQLDLLEDDPLAQRSVHVGSSALVTYELAPMSFLYAGYSDTRREFDPREAPGAGLLPTGSQLFLKVSYLFRVDG